MLLCPKMNVLVTGGNSLLGKALWESAPPHVSLLVTDLPERGFMLHKHQTAVLDVTQASAVSQTVRRFHPQVVIHLASLSDVDACESHPQRARQVNVQGTENLVTACKENGAKLIFASSNGVFDGQLAPYSERSRPHPIYVYGETKLEGEERIRSALRDHLILRLMTLYGWPPRGARANPVTWAIAKLQRGQVLQMVTDQFVNPLYAPSAAEAIWKLVANNRRGTYHVAGATRVSRYAWTRAIAKVFGYDPQLVKPVTASFFARLTSRPKDTTLTTTKLQQAIDWKPLTLKAGLTVMKKSRPR